MPIYEVCLDGQIVLICIHMIEDDLDVLVVESSYLTSYTKYINGGSCSAICFSLALATNKGNKILRKLQQGLIQVASTNRLLVYYSQ